MNWSRNSLQTSDELLTTAPDLLKWVGNFIDKHCLAGDHKNVLVSLSGGPDSMLLSHVCEALKTQGRLHQVRHFHVDHGLRAESSEEAFMLKDLAKKWGWDFHLQKITGAIPKGNVEKWARDQRRKLVESYRREDEVIFTGHNIDDSFEWFLRRQLGASQSESTQGIPLINGPIRRPFHCLTSEQVRRFCRRLNLPVIEDKSNKDPRFQRNALRQQVKRPLLNLFPKGLAHYVERSNQWAREKKLYPQTTGTLKNTKPKKGELHERFKGPLRLSFNRNIVCWYTFNPELRWEDHQKELLETIKELSGKDRGELRLNFKKLLEASLKPDKRGPLSFSGGVKVFIYPGTLIFLNEVGLEEFKKIDEKLSLRIHIASQIPKVSLQDLHSQWSLLGGLPFVFTPNEFLGLKSLKEDPLFKNVIQETRKHNGVFRPASQLYFQAIKKERPDYKAPLMPFLRC